MIDYKEPKQPGRRVSFTFEHASCGDARFAPMIRSAMAEYGKADPMGSMSSYTANNGVTITIVSLPPPEN